MDTHLGPENSTEHALQIMHQQARSMEIDACMYELFRILFWKSNPAPVNYPYLPAEAAFVCPCRGYGPARVFQDLRHFASTGITIYA
jgi:hypothetical protein